jgi:hypothetical protein
MSWQGNTFIGRINHHIDALFRSIRRYQPDREWQGLKGGDYWFEGWCMGNVGGVHGEQERPLSFRFALRDLPQLTLEEQKAILNGFIHSDAVLASGIRLHGEKFFVVRADGRSIYGKKTVCPNTLQPFDRLVIRFFL